MFLCLKVSKYIYVIVVLSVSHRQERCITDIEKIYMDLEDFQCLPVHVDY